MALAGAGLLSRVGLVGAAFVGALVGVLLTLVLARGAQQTVRLLLAGVVVGVVLAALSDSDHAGRARGAAWQAGVHARQHRLPGLGQRARCWPPAWR